MKTKLLFLSVVMMLSSLTMFFTAGCSDDGEYAPEDILLVDEVEGYSSIDLVACQNNLNFMPLGILSDPEKESILFMREEEKLARDVYFKMEELWGLNIFQNISQSEETHMDAVLQLINKYNLTDPAAGNLVGAFTNDSLQTLYNQLLPLGQTGVVEALEVGALIEEVDIRDLMLALENVVVNQDVRLVYENLCAASRNHLRAFVKNLKNRGVTYVPQVLTQAEYDDIINKGWETGH